MTGASSVKAHLVDGTYELFRAFFGAPSATAPDGREVGATRGLLRTLLQLINDKEVTHLAAAFDTVIESFRNDMFDGYKTGDGIDRELVAQFPLAERASAALGIVTWGLVEFEADDAIATAAARLTEEASVGQVVICSPDKDMAQCVIGERVVCRDRMRRKTIGEDGVMDKFGVEPASIPDWLALVGDNADGIPGIARWGAKSAAAVLRRYRHIAAIPDDDATWDLKVRGAAGLAKNLREQREDADLYRDLATLRLDVPLGETLEDLRWRGARQGELAALCEELGMRPQWLEQVPAWRDD